MASFTRARVLSQAHELYLLLPASAEPGREQWGKLAGRLRHLEQLPAVGDWVFVTETEPPLIVEIEPRRSVFLRGDPGGGVQVLAANLDVAFLVCGLDDDFNPRRLDRYIVQTHESGARAVVVLNKADLCASLPRLEVDAPVAAISALRGDVGALRSFVQPGETAALFGSSGVGKSTILNALLGRTAQPVGTTSGQHTTTARRIVLLEWGWWLLDMPGLRELALSSSAGSVAESFREISAAACRFRDCRHENEPGCVIRGVVAEQRLESWRKLQREQAYAERKDNPAAARAEKEKWKKIHKALRTKTKK